MARLCNEYDKTTESLRLATKAADDAQRALERPAVAPVDLDLSMLDSSLDAIRRRVAPLSIDIGKTIKDGLVQGIGSIAAAIGGALESGANVLKTFVNAVKGIMGQMLMTIGQSFITAGLAKLHFDAMIISLFGGAGAIAIGVGLVAAGAALASSGSRGAAQTAQASSGGGGGYYQPVTGGGAQGQGSLTIVFPAHSVFDPGDPTQMDAFVNMLEQASGRNVIVQRRA